MAKVQEDKPVADVVEAGANQLLISLLAHPTLNYAFYQNNIPLIRSLTLTNGSSEPLLDLDITIRAEPSFAEPMRLKLEQLKPGEVRTFDALDLKIQHKYLAELNEAERGRLIVEVTRNDEVLARADHAIDVLAYDQWAGSRGLPELLAAFSLPNNPAVDRLIYQAGQLLEQVRPGQAMSGYQSKNRDDVWAQMSALYSAVAAANLQYSSPPASFGTEGQKIRTPDRILANGVATCLDLTMLLAACFEQAGLHPLVLLKSGHAWVGCWLINTTLPTATLDDAQALRKRVASGELLVLETTLLTSRPAVSLKAACETGLQHLHEDAKFLYAIDIKRARMEQIRPLPIRVDGGPALEQRADDVPAPAVESPPELPPLDGEAFTLDEDARPETAAGRLARWKSKLLDLTLRNRMLNFKHTKSTLPLRVPDPAHLEDQLSDGVEWKFKAMPQLMQGADPRVAAVAARRHNEDPLDAAAKEAMQRHEILAAVDAKVLEARLYEIHSTARLSLEEGGANTLYLAIGFLRWAEDERAEKTHLAPLLLVPVTLTRQGVRSGYAIKRHDDESIVNPTLLQLLRERYQLTLKAVEVLPADESGVDVKKIWQTFRLAVKDIPRWEVIEEVCLGIFSFTKYLMWKDLHDRTEDLKRNPVVKHLIERPRAPMGAPDDLAHRDDLDERHAPGALMTPMLADSSQLNAISRADQGHDFALEGPPGTGKSQTITNLIAHFLGSGKTVLFVSEKMAALDVVRRRLHVIGLGPFCLELHSSKARKVEVLEQLRLALEVGRQRTATEWQREAERLASLRNALNDLVRALHREHRNGLTVRLATDTAILHRQREPSAMPWSEPDAHDVAALDALRELMRTTQSVLGEVGDLNGHALSLVRYTEWTHAWEEQLVKNAAMLDSHSEQLQSAAIVAGSILGLKLDTASYALLERVDGLIEVLLNGVQLPKGVRASAGESGAKDVLHKARTTIQARAQHWSRLASTFKPDMASLDGQQHTEAWASACAAWWPKRWFAQRTFIGRLMPWTLSGERPALESINDALSALRALNGEDRALSQLEVQAVELLGDGYAGAQTNVEHLELCIQWSHTFAEAISRFGSTSNADAIRLFTQRTRKLLVEQVAALQPGGDAAARLIAFREAWRRFREQLQVVANASMAADDLCGALNAAGVVPRVHSTSGRWRAARKALRSWCRWRQLRGEALTLGLDSVVSDLEAGRIASAQLELHFEYSYQTWWLKAVIDRDPALRNFSSADHERRIREFRTLDERFEKLTEKHITAVLAGRVPRAVQGQRPDPELALVTRELAKQRAHLPVRRLVQGMPSLIHKLKPCLLMSPLSVSQYLDASHANFDVVVFDEASQIPVWDAVGAIARGKQVIVVGDPKQLPPTNFFQRSDDAEDEQVEAAEDAPVQDLESILDECLGAGMGTLRLEWHYRSRNESLITFSNHRYYDSRLVTFPSPVTQDSAVKLHWVAGIYDRGGSRTNRVEAETVVQQIVAHFEDAARRALTLGVVTFNQPQQRLIEQLLDAELVKRPDLEQRVADHGPERLFIKNLENVQGDERDVILFSTTYGKDAAGRMPMNFGPLNQEGGHRRLNVAITRARVGVTIFSSIRAEEIDVSRTRATGVIDLKNYLEFAVRGPSAIVEQSLPTGIEPESPFEMEVIRHLRDKGWTVHPQVGCSGYRIDMAVVHPQLPGEYLLGVECDGATYHSLPTARDRDRLRQHVLEGLGWQLHRIWSSDWWADPDREVQKLDTCLRECVLGYQRR